MARPWNLSCPDWEQRLRAGTSLVPPLPLNEAEADLALSFFNQLRLPDVPGTPLLEDAAGDWFKDIVRVLFGSWNASLGVRHIEEVFCLVPKKNSKTTYGAALMIVALLMNVRPRAEFLLVAPTHAISELAFSQAEGIIVLNPELSKRFHVRDHLKTIDDRLNDAHLKIKTFDLDILTGPRPAGVLMDEVHLLGKHPQAAKVFRQLRGGRQSTPEGFMVMLTTQSDGVPAGVFKDELASARAIRDGKAPGKMLPIMYEFPSAIVVDRAQWESRENWPMVMPNLGRSLDLERLSADYESEKLKGEEAVRLWASQHLNVEIGVALMSDHWNGARYWPEAVDRSLTLEEILVRSEAVVVGIDGGGLDDLLALCVLGRDSVTKEWLHWARAWAHPIVLERRKDIASRLRDFERDGDLIIVDTLGQDIDGVVDVCAAVDDAGLLAQVGLDPVGIGAIVDALAERGIGGPGDSAKDKDRVVGVSQGWKLSGAVKTAERKVADGTMTHSGQPLMTWAVGNARTEPRGNALVITKQVSGSAKIDPLMATLNAVALMSVNPRARRRVSVDDFLQNAVVG